MPSTTKRKSRKWADLGCITGYKYNHETYVQPGTKFKARLNLLDGTIRFLTSSKTYGDMQICNAKNTPLIVMRNLGCKFFFRCHLCHRQTIDIHVKVYHPSGVDLLAIKPL